MKVEIIPYQIVLISELKEISLWIKVSLRYKHLFKKKRSYSYTNVLMFF